MGHTNGPNGQVRVLAVNDGQRGENQNGHSKGHIERVEGARAQLHRRVFEDEIHPQIQHQQPIIKWTE